MAKEILLYGNINDDSATKFVTELNDALEEDIVVRVNSNGGEVNCTWAMVAKFSEHVEGSKLVKVDGKAFSGGAFFCVYADDVECFDVSEFLFHRAAYPEWFEANPEWFDDVTKAALVNMNNRLKAAFDSRINADALQDIMDKKPELAGAKVKDIFSMDSRIDVRLSAKEAKKIGLVNRIKTITPSKKAEIKSLEIRAYAFAADIEEVKQDKPITNDMIDLQKLKMEHPALYNEVIAIGTALGVAQEKDRVEAAMVWLEIDPEGVKAVIASGGPISAKQAQEFQLKAMSASQLAAIKKESPSGVKTAESNANPAATQEDLDNEAVMADFRKRNNLPAN